MKVVTCFFGRKSVEILPAPTEHSIFFTNNEDLTDKVQERGWHCVKVDIPLLDLYQSSLQAKWVKYLQFLTDDTGEYLYCDHKIPLTTALVDQIRRIASKNILVIRHRVAKRTVAKEFYKGTIQPRYASARKQTLNYLAAFREKGYSLKSPVMMTGMIYYQVSPEVLEFTRAVFAGCMKTGNPHCQLFWALHAQKYPHLVEAIEKEFIGQVSLL
jgi:hypothetical protein